jgi:small subunit ribosomal protein S6
MQTKHYETTFILKAFLTKEERKEIVNKFTRFLQEQGAEIVHRDNYERSLAYPIEKHTRGFYEVTEFKTDKEAVGQMINKLELMYKQDERVLRYLTIRLDKHAVAYNENLRSNNTKVTKQPTEGLKNN